MGSSGQSRRVGWVSRAVGRRRLRGGASRAAGNVFEVLEGRQLFAVAIPVGGELLVNTTTAETQLVNPRGHTAAVDANGNSVIVWQSFGNDGSGYGIFGRRFDASGTPRGAEFQINAVALNNQTLPAVAMDASGDFVVAWRDLARSGDADLGGIYARRFDADGLALGDDFLVNTTTAGDQNNPVVAMGPGGETVIAWDGPAPGGTSLDVYARRYDASGAAVGGEFRVNTYTADNQFGPSVTVGADGRFVLAWESFGQDGDQEGIYAQRFGPSGAPQGGEFHVSTQTSSRQRNPGIDMDSAGNFVVAWSSNRQDPSSTGVFSQRFDASGTPLGGEYRVNVETYQAQMYPSLSMDDAGNYVVSWVSDLQDGNSSGIFARQYNAAGVAQTGDVQVNTYTTGEQLYPSVAMDARGNFVAAWQSRYQDGSAWGIYAQRFAVPDPNNTAPVAAASQSIVVLQDSPASTVDLWDLFADAQTADASLSYTVISNTNAAVAATLNAAAGTLTLNYLTGASGNGQVVVRATDPGGLHADLTLNVTVTAVVSPPAAPAAQGAVAVSARRVDVSWTDNSANETGFTVERSPNGTSGWAPVGTAAAGATSFADTTVAPSSTYHYRVFAFNDAGASAATAVMTATTPAENDVTRSFRADDPAVVWGGAFSAPFTQGGRSARGMTSQYGDWTTVVSGHSASMSVYAFVADALSITVDGVTITPTLPINAWADVQLFSNLADGPHTVTIRNRHTRHQASLEIGRMITATGSNPGVSLRSGFSQNVYVAGTAAGVQTDGTMALQNINGNPNSLVGVDSSFRIRTAASSIKLWMNLATDRVRLSIDGVEQQSASAILPDGANNAGGGLGGMGWYDFATGLDTSREHEYRLWFHGTGTSSDTSIVSQIMLVGGTLNPTPPAALPMLVGYGDSITLAQGAATNHDSGLGFVHRVGVSRDMATFNMGVSGSTVHNFGGTGATGARSGTARVGQIPTAATDVFVLYGTNDAANAAVDATIFRADYQSMIAGIRARVPSARVYCIDLLPTRNATINAKRGAFNAEIAGVVAAAADPNLIHVRTDGIGFDPAAHTYDGVHPTAAGYAVLDPYFRSFMPSTADTTAPTVTGASIDAAGTTLTLNFSENVTGVSAADYQLTGGLSLGNAQGTGATRTFTLSPAAQFGQSYTLGYSGAGTRDASGNTLATFSARPVTNDVPAPVPAAPSNVAAAANSSSLVTVTWSDNSGNETGFKVERSATGTGGWTLLSTTGPGATSYLDGSVAAQTTYFYRVAATNAFGDSAYATAAPVTTPAAPDLTAPVIQSATGNGATLTLAYDEALDPAATPAAGAFAVTGRTVTAVSISGSSVRLTVSPAFAAGEDGGAVSYSVSGTPVRDSAGNHAAAFTAIPVANATVAQPNRNPAASDDAATTPAGVEVTVDVLANDTDADGDALAVTVLGSPAHGTVVLTGPGAVTYTPAAGFNGVDEFTYAIGDGRGGTATATVRVSVGQFNTAPTVLTASTSAGEVGDVSEGQTVNLSAAFSDAGSTDTHSVSIDWGDGTVAAGTVNAALRTAAGSHVYAAAGAYPVTLTLTDNHGASATRQLTAYVSGAAVRGGVLYVIGSRADDRVYVQMVTGQIRATGAFIAGTHRYFDPAGIAKVLMILGDGNDQGSIYPNTVVPGVIDGGNGNDALNGGTRSLLIGGAGADTLTGSGAADVLVGGTAAFAGDASSLLQALDGTLPLGPSNLFNDASADTLTGGSATDTFWGNFSGGGVLDVLGSALQTGESLSDLP